VTLNLLIDGELVDGASALDVINPSTGQVFAQAARADATLAARAISAAKRAVPAWNAQGYAGRSKVINAFASAIEARFGDFSRLLTQESGKPLAEAESEVGGTIAALRWAAAQELKPTILRETDHELIIEQHYPQGVVAAITPWNFPMILLIFKIGPALIAGNAVIAKPAPTTPLTTLLLGEVAAAIFPAGVFQTLVDLNDLGPLLTTHPDVAHVSFTGSTPTGKKVLASAVDTLKRFTLELGGNDAAIVLDDVEIERFAPRIFEAAMLNAGQTCLATKRVYAPRHMVDELARALGRLAEETTLGDGLEPGVTMGPIQNRAQYEKLLGFLQEARSEGVIVAGGPAVAGAGYFIRPTIVTGLPAGARLIREEQFGPILPVIAYDDIDDAVAQANDTDFGLGGIIWTADVARGVEVASRIETGTIWINQFLAVPFDVAIGGAKQSGLGVQNGLEGIKEFTQRRVVNAKKTL
jgi:acyl-CoA reductase-like NAD-dependent aldehyde dehydrogenase